MKKMHEQQKSSVAEHEVAGFQTRESYRIERVVQIARASIGVLALVILFSLRRFVPMQSVIPVYIGSAILIMHSIALAIVFVAVKSMMKKRLLRVLQYLSSVVDIATVSMALWMFGPPDTFKSNVFLLYFLFIALSAFRYSRSLTIFTSLFSIVVYLGMFAVAVLQGSVTLGTLSDEYSGSAISILSLINKATVLFVVSVILSDTARGYAKLIRRITKFTRASQAQERHAEDMRLVFQRYFTEDVADHIWNNRQQLFSERKEVTVMFCDFRNFTELTNRLPTEHVVAILNSYLSEMVALVFKYNGTLDKYTGDGFMAIFGAPLSKGNDPYNALCVAVEVERCVKGLNERYKATIPDGLHVRIGISTGEAIAGTIGSEQRTEYTVIGEPVNLASRLESLNKLLRTTILMSETTYRKTEELVRVEYHGRFAIRGIHKPVRVFELIEVPQISVGEMEALEEV